MAHFGYARQFLSSAQKQAHGKQYPSLFIVSENLKTLVKAPLGIKLCKYLGCSKCKYSQFLKYFFFLDKFIYLLIDFWLHWVFVVAHGLSLVVASGATLPCGVWASHCGGFSCCGARALGTQASVVAACGLSSCSLRALEHRAQ